MRGLLRSYAALVLILLYLPLGVLAVFAFNDSRAMRWTGLTFHWFTDLFRDRRLRDVLLTTIVIGIGTTAVSVALGTLVALPLSRFRFRGRRLVNALVTLPLMVPDIALGIALLMFFTALGIPLGRVTVILAQSTFGLAYAAMVVAARLHRFDRNLEHAARDLGATPWQAFRLVTFPAIRPAIVASSLLCFTLSFDDFVITYFTTGPGTTTIPVEIYGMVKRGISPKINALSTLLFMATLVLTVLAARLHRLGTRGG